MDKLLPSAKDAFDRANYNKESKAKTQMIEIINDIERAIGEGCTKCNFYGTVLPENRKILELNLYVLNHVQSGYNESATEISWNNNKEIKLKKEGRI